MNDVLAAKIAAAEGEKICAFCTFWKHTEGTEEGECNRYPPNVGKGPGNDSIVQPQVAWNDDQCGEVSLVQGEGGQ